MMSRIGDGVVARQRYCNSAYYIVALKMDRARRDNVLYFWLPGPLRRLILYNFLCWLAAVNRGQVVTIDYRRWLAWPPAPSIFGGQRGRWLAELRGFLRDLGVGFEERRRNSRHRIFIRKMELVKALHGYRFNIMYILGEACGEVGDDGLGSR